jgi:hypothetical protein
LWKLPAENLLALNDIGLVPLISLAAYAGPPEDLLRRFRERIDRQAEPEERAILLAASQVLARLRYTEEQLLRFFGGDQAMIESPLIDEVLARVMQRTILRVLFDRFGPVPQDTDKKLRTIYDHDRLEELTSWAARCPDLAAFAAKLDA